MEINLKTQWNKLNSLFRVAIILFLFLFSQFTVIWSQTITFSENIYICLKTRPNTPPPEEK